MASSLLAALAALVTALFAVASPSATEPDASGRPSHEQVRQSVDDFRASLQALVQEALAAANTAAPQSAGSPASITPLEAPDSPAREQSPASDEDGCKTDHEAGEGWSRTEVRCVQQSAGGSSSVSVSSSSSVSVEQTSSDDAP